MNIAILIGICGIMILSAIVLLILSLSYDIKSKRVVAKLSNHRDALHIISGLIDRLEEQERTTNAELKSIKEETKVKQLKLETEIRSLKQEVDRLNTEFKKLSVYIDATLIK